MKFVTSRGDTNNPQWLKDSASKFTPEILKLASLPKGFRFELTDPEHIQRVKQGQFTVEDDGSPKSEVAIAKIDAEVADENQRLKQLEMSRKAADKAAKRASKNWYERPVGIVILMVLGAVIAYVITDMIFPHWLHSQKQ